MFMVKTNSLIKYLIHYLNTELIAALMNLSQGHTGTHTQCDHYYVVRIFKFFYLNSMKN